MRTIVRGAGVTVQLVWAVFVQGRSNLLAIVVLGDWFC